MSKIIPLSVPEDFHEEVQAAAKELQMSRQEVIRQSVRLGMPKLRESLSVVRPDGYFADDYPEPEERRQLRAALASVPHSERK